MKKLPEIAIQMEASARGWINYYGKFYPNNMKIALQALNHAIVRWAVRKDINASRAVLNVLGNG